MMYDIPQINHYPEITNPPAIVRMISAGGDAPLRYRPLEFRLVNTDPGTAVTTADIEWILRNLSLEVARRMTQQKMEDEPFSYLKPLEGIDVNNLKLNEDDAKLLAILFNELGYAYFIRGRSFPAAEKYLRAAYKLDKGNPNILYNLAQNLAYLGSIYKFRRSINDALSLVREALNIVQKDELGNPKKGHGELSKRLNRLESWILRNRPKEQ